MEDSKDDQEDAVVSILKDVVATQHLQHELPVFVAPPRWGDRASDVVSESEFSR